MKALIQRVSSASVEVEGNIVGAIERGVLVLIGFEPQDDDAGIERMMQRLMSYRMFEDKDGKMNLSVRDIEGGMLLVSQFTLAANTKKGLRPSFSGAAAPAHAEKLYNNMLSQAHKKGLDESVHIASGTFGANMQVSLTNEGPVTFLLEI